MFVAQVCINQQDNTEKSAQVALMGDIYRRCSRARIWLGCDASECNLRHQNKDERKTTRERTDPFEFTRLLENHVNEWPCFVKHGEDKTRIRFEPRAAFLNVWNRHMKIYQSLWWSRMWTVQEAVLPPKASIMYDTWSMLFEEFLDHGNKALTSHVKECCGEAFLLLPVRMRIEMILQVTKGDSLRCDLGRLRREALLNLDSCLVNHGHRQCHDPRDKIYGMLGLINDESRKILPDYSASLASVFYHATSDLLEAPGGGLHSLIGVQHGPSVHKWASWVRDFDQQCTQHHNSMNTMKKEIYTIFNAGGSTPSSYEIWSSWPCLPDLKPNQVALAVTGRCVGTITAISQETCALREMPVYGQAGASSCFKAWMHFAEFDSEAHATGRHSTANEQIWRTILCGVVNAGKPSDSSNWRRFKSDDMKLLGPFVHFLETGIMPGLYEPTSSTHTTACSKTYFRTRSGGHGLCYPTCRPGDQVWVLHGARVPFVLRSIDVDTKIEENVLRPPEAYIRDNTGSIIGVKEGFEPRTAHYQLIGDCYYDEFMDGEGLDDEKYHAQPILLV